MGPLAHETWFTDETPGYSLDFVLQPATLAVIAAAVVIAGAWRSAMRRFPPPELPWLQAFGGLAPWIPRLLAVHAGVSLLAQAARGTYLAPALELPQGVVGTALAILEGITGVWLISGYRTRPAASLLIAAGPAGALFYGVVPVLERVDLLGIATFLAILPPDDDRPGGTTEAPPEVLYRSLLSLRLLVGGALVVLAFTEKLARPDLALAFLERYPAFNIMRSLGLHVGDLDFIRLAGGVELLFGLLVISGALPQVTTLVAGVPFNATLFFFGASELIGHLPVYGAMLALLVYGSDPDTAPLVPKWPGLRRAATTVRERVAGSGRQDLPTPERGRG